jgi:phage tail tape-measure protein
MGRHIAALALLFAAVSAFAGDVTGAGSTFVYPLMAKWAATYYARTGRQIDYQPIGSGNGIRQIKAASITFGTTDMPLKPEELERAGLVQFPIAVGGVVPVINLQGIGAGQIHMTGAAGRYLSRQDRQLERCGHCVGQSRRAVSRPEDHGGPSQRRLGHHVQLDRLPFQGQPRMEGGSRGRHHGALARRDERERQ